MHFASVFTMLALASRCAYGQPTIDVGAFDDLFHWRDGRQLLEQMVTSLQCVIVQQERQQQAQDRLEQMLNESVEGQRRLEMQVSQLQQQQQQVDNQMTRYASLQHQYHQHQQQQLTFSSMIDNITAKLEVVSGDVSVIKNTLSAIKNQSTDESIAHTLMMEFRNLPMRLVDTQQSVLASYEQKRRNQSAEQLEIITASIAPIRQGLSQLTDVMEETVTTKVQNAVVHELSDFATNVSQKLTESGDKHAELCRVRIKSMMKVGNVSLEELRGVSHQIDAQQLQQQARDDILLGKMMELINSTSQSQLSVLSKYEDIRNNVRENISQLLGALTMVKQEQNQLVEFVSNGFQQKIEVVALESRQAIANNLSLQLTGLGEVLRERLIEMTNSTTMAIQEERTTLPSNVSDSISQVLGTLANISRSQDHQQAAADRLEGQLQFLKVVALGSGIRLVGCRGCGGGQCREGRLEVLNPAGLWGTVCDDNFGTADARVACHSLGFR